MVANILGHIACYFFLIILVCFLGRVAWNMIPKILRESIKFSVKGTGVVAKPIMIYSANLVKKSVKGKDSKAETKKVKEDKKKDKDDEENKKTKPKKAKSSHLKIVK